MTGDGRERRREFDAVSRALLRCANRGEPRTEFLRQASTAILGVTHAEGLDLWLEDGELSYHWQAVAQPHAAFRLANLSSGPTAKNWPRGSRGRQAPALLERVLPLVDDGGRLATSAARTAGGSLWLEQVAIVPFEIDVENEGVLRVGSAKKEFLTQDQVQSYEDLAQLLGVAMANRRAQAALTERVKELTCMYRIAQIAAESTLSLDDTLQEIVELLPPAWQYPNITTARIVLAERTFRSRRFEVGPHRLSADVHVQGTQRGRVEVFYADECSLDETLLLEGDPFLDDERHLIQAVARELSFIIERRFAEDEKVRLQEQIRHGDRLATVGQLAAGVAHELNEPLGNILGFAQLANKSPNLPAQTRSDLGRIVTASLYAREIIKNLMFFSRQTPSQRTVLNLNKVVEDGLALLEPRCTKAGIAVVRELAPELPVVHGDPTQLQQVLVNLLVNAIQAMPDGGKLHVGTVAEEDMVCVILEDTGVGIPAENLESIFVPFFTTKDVGQGTGLGLSVVHGIMSSHGGSVQADSKVGSGTRFEVRLPTQLGTVSESAGDTG